MATYTLTSLSSLTTAALWELVKNEKLSPPEGVNRDELVAGLAAHFSDKEATGSATDCFTKAAAAILEDIQMSLRAGSKKVQIGESNEVLQAMVEARLSPEDRTKVVWGGSTVNSVVR